VNDELVNDWNDPDGCFAAFKQRDATDYFYALNGGEISARLPTCRRKIRRRPVKQNDVLVIYSHDSSGVGHGAGKGLRGVHVAMGRTFKENRGIGDQEWLLGFDYEFVPDRHDAGRAFIPCD